MKKWATRSKNEQKFLPFKRATNNNMKYSSTWKYYNNENPESQKRISRWGECECKEGWFIIREKP